MSDDSSSSVYHAVGGFPPRSENPVTAADATELADLVSLVEADGVTVRGFYDVSGLRADADSWSGSTAKTPRPFSATCDAASHRPAEESPAHVERHGRAPRRGVQPLARARFLRGIEASSGCACTPSSAAYEWYLLPEAERREMLIEHGKKGSAYKGVFANTVASFALGDYEWLLPMEATS